MGAPKSALYPAGDVKTYHSTGTSANRVTLDYILLVFKSAH
jgi:hypothetical protein